MKELYFGVDIGGTTVKIGCFDNEGNMLHKYEIVTRKDEGGKFIIPDIISSVKEYTISTGESEDAIKGIGVGVPGPVIEDRIVLNCVNLGWGVIDVAKEVKALLDVEVKVGNDANMAALGEMFKGGGMGADNVVMITLGTGVGGGVIIDGKILNGKNGAAGEIGHMPVAYDEPDKCTCGKKGCLEQMASATGIVKQTKRILATTDKKSVLKGKEAFTAKDVFDAAHIGDEVAVMAVERLGFYLGTALAHVACTIDPEVFVIGGGVSKAGDILTDSVEKVYKEQAFNPSKGTKITLATLGNDAGMYGAVKLVL